MDLIGKIWPRVDKFQRGVSPLFYMTLVGIRAYMIKHCRVMTEHLELFQLATNNDT